MADYQRRQHKFTFRGMILSRPIDLLQQGEYAIAKNIRSYEEGVIEPRPGFSLAGDLDLLLADAGHSLRALNDDIAADYTLVTGAGTRLYTGKTTFTNVPNEGTGWAGKTISLVPHRPNQSPRPWMYASDPAKMAKVGLVSGVYTGYKIGISPPITAPSTALDGFSFKIVSDFEAITGWTAGGTAGVPTAPSRVSTTISAIVFDTGTTGWASVVPVAMTSDWQVGMLITAGGVSETVIVEQVFSPITNTTISSIVYDSGTTGLCTIQLAGTTIKRKHKKKPPKVVPPDTTGLVPDSALQIDLEVVRVLSVTIGKDGIPSLRCSTASNHLAGGTVTGLKSFRAKFVNNHVAAQTLATNAIQSALTTGTGTLTLTTALDLSTINGRPVNDDDEMSIQIRIDDLSKLTSGQLMLDVDGSANDFAHNYYFREFAPSDFVPAIKQTSTVLTTQRRHVQRIIVDEFRRTRRVDSFEVVSNPFAQPVLDGGPFDIPFGEGPVQEETATGDNQWTTIRFKIGGLTRVGTDPVRTLRDVAAIRLSLVASGSITASVDAWWIGGTFGPDISNIGTPYLYRYRARSSVTGAVSNPGPATRSGAIPHRQRVILTGTQQTDPQADKIDWYRFGGSLNDWRYLGTSENSAAPTFNDDFPDDTILNSTLLDFENFQPFIVADIPRSGVCNVTGTMVSWVSGDQFSLKLAEGTQIIINGVPQIVYATPASATRLEIVESAGTLTSVTFTIPSGTLIAQPLPAMWGPYGGGFTGVFMFGCGDSRQAGTLFWTRGNNPDAVATSGQLELTSGSEQLMNGGLYDGRPFVFSSERQWFVYPNFGGPSDFTAQEVANSKGLFARYGLVVGPKIWFVSKDGIYETEGGQPQSITNNSLYPLFPHDGQPGRVTNGIQPPDFTQPDLMRLSYSDGLLYYDYKDLAGSFHTLCYDTYGNKWMLDEYTPAATYHYSREGRGVHELLVLGSDGKLYTSGGTSDAGSAIACQVRTLADNADDTRAKKDFGDLIVDANTAGVSATLTVGLDNYSSTLTPLVMSNAARGLTIAEVNQLAVNLAIDLTWSSTLAAPKFYEWQPSFIVRPEDVKKRPLDWTDAGYSGTKEIRGVIIDCDTGGATKTVELQRDGGTVATTLSIVAGTRQRVVFAVTPFEALTLRLNPTDTGSWRVYSVDWIFERRPDTAAIYSEWTDAGDPRAKLMQGVWIESDTKGIARTVQILYDGGTVGATVSVTTSGRTAKFFEFPATFLAHNLRLVPSGAMQIFSFRFLFTPQAELAAIINDWTDDGQLGDKFLQGVVIDADTGGLAVTLQVQYDGGTILTSLSASHNGRVEKPYAFTSPVIAHNFRLVPTIGIIRIYNVRWIWIPKPELVQVEEDWTDAGRPGPKFIQGVLIEADTAGVARTITIYRDGDTVTAAATISVTHSQQKKTFFPLTPFIAYTLKLVPSGAWRLFKAEWLWTDRPVSSSITNDFTDDGFIGPKFLTGLVIEADSEGGLVTFQIQVDGGTVAQTVLASGLWQGGRVEVPVALTTPVVAHNFRIVPTVGTWRLYGVRWVHFPYPDNAQLTPDFGDGGFAGDKFVRALIVEADTLGAAVNVQLQSDGGTVQQTLSVTHNGRRESVFTVVAPFVTKMLRLVPQGAWRFFSVRYIYDEWAEKTTAPTAWEDDNYPGEKFLRGIVIEADTENLPVNLQVQTDGGTVAATLSVTHNGRVEKPYAIGPVNAHNFRLVPVAIVLPSSNNPIRMFRWRWLYNQWPESAQLTEDWGDGGYQGAKYVYGLIVEADTSNLLVSVQVQSDSGTIQQTISMTHNGRVTKSYAITTPFIASSLRLVPQGVWRLFSVKWVVEPYPELLPLVPDYTDAGYQGTKRVRGVVIEADTAGVSQTITVKRDGGTTVTTLSVSHAGRMEVAYNLTPFLAGTLQLSPSGPWRYFSTRWLYDQYPENIPGVLDFSNDGQPSAKLLQGVVIEADTSNLPVSVDVQTDGGAVLQTLSVQHNGRNETAFSFTAPAITHEMRLVPAAAWRLFGVRWIWKPKPENVAIVEDWTDGGRPGDKFIQGVLVEADTGGVSRTISIYKDGDTSVAAATIAVNHAAQKKTFFPLVPFIAKTLKLSPSGAWRFFGADWLFTDRPELTTTTPDFTDDGYLGPKFLTSVAIEADTSNLPVALDLQVDGTSRQTITITHNGRIEAEYALTSPVIGHNFRLVPTAIVTPPSNNPVRMYGTRWVWEKYPDNAQLTPDLTDAGLAGDKFVRALIIEADTLGSPVNVQLQSDGGTVQQIFSVSHNGRRESVFAVTTPFITKMLRLVPQGVWRFFAVRYIYDEWAEKTTAPTVWEDDNYPGEKFLRGIVIEADTENLPVSLQVQTDGGTIVATLSLTHNGRVEKPYAIGPVNAHNFRLVPVAIALPPSNNPIRIFRWRWLYNQWPENVQLTEDWSDGGYLGAKYVYGLVVEADTGNQAVSIQIQSDTGVVQQTVSMTHNGRVIKSYAIAAPFVASSLRLVPQGTWRFFGVRWVTDPYPELATFTPDFSDAGLKGAKRVYGVKIEADTAGLPVTVTVQRDGGIAAATISLNHAGRLLVPYAITPFIGQELRLVPSAPWRYFSTEWIFEPYPENLALVPDYDDLGAAGAKFINGVVLEADTGGNLVSMQAQVDGVVVTTLIISHSGKVEKTYPIGPVVGFEARLVPLDSVRSFKARWLADPYPENAALTPDWSDLGTPVPKYFRGLILEADTSNALTSVQVQRDGGILVTTLSVTANGRVELPFALTPFAAYEVRLVPQGSWRFFKARWIYDEYPDLAPIATPWTDSGYVGPKYIRSVTVEADTGGALASAEFQTDGGTVAATLALNHNGRTEVNYPLASPVIAYETRIAPIGAARIFKYVLEYDQYPDLTQKLTGWSDAGQSGPKFFQRLFLLADTNNLPVNVQVQYDGGTIATTLTATHNGQVEIPYSFPAFIGHTIRLVPQGAIRIFGARWIFESVPELVSRWEVQRTSHDSPGYKHVRDIFVSHISTSDITLTLTVDGVSKSYVIPNSNGTHTKSLIAVEAVKGKMFSYLLTSAAGFRLFQRDSEVRLGDWLRGEGYRTVRPFGEVSRAAASKFDYGYGLVR